MKSHPHIELVNKHSKAAQKATLSSAEKTQMKETLRENMKVSPVHLSRVQTVAAGAALAPSAYFLYSWSLAGTALSGKKKFVAPIMLLLIVGGGTSYAAEGSVPGDLLYPVKINVNESVFSALSFSALSQAKWAVEKVGRRIAEAKSAEVNAAGKAELNSEALNDSQVANAKIAAISAGDPADAQALSSQLGLLLKDVAMPTSTVAATSSTKTSLSTPVFHATPKIRVPDSASDTDDAASATDTAAASATPIIPSGLTPVSALSSQAAYYSAPSNSSPSVPSASGASASVSASVSAPTLVAPSAPAVSVPSIVHAVTPAVHL